MSAAQTLAQSLSHARWSLDHTAFKTILAETPNLLIIQDLDGVCMGLVQDPLQRAIAPEYVQAAQLFEPHFYVLTNGEHIGSRGVNHIVEQAFASPEQVQQAALYLPGLAAGGVQWQTRNGQVSHPGVSEAELAFLQAIPARLRAALDQFFVTHIPQLEPQLRHQYVAACVLDNVASPTLNLNTAYAALAHQVELYQQLQQAAQHWLEELQTEATQNGLADAFFLHLAPNLGHDADGAEILKSAQTGDSGTTDFQFMLRGAIKEAGVLAILNHYYAQRTGRYPLGQDFSARQAPKTLPDLLACVKTAFDPVHMPLMVGVGDTVTSQGMANAKGQLEFKRGGSDRHFLELIQAIGQAFEQPNLVVYIDSSQGEVKNRKPLELEQQNGQPIVVEGPGDARDTHDPLTLNVVFPDGHVQYTTLFQQAAQQRQAALAAAS
ncbi:MAG: glucosylglycerol 3-phosphatase [Cyanobacteria bacterium P01_H01_bin.121]